MKNFIKRHKKIFIISLIVIVLAVTSIIFYNILTDENALTVEERTWIDDNTNSVLNINVVNNVNIFGSEGEGIYYDFLEDFANTYNLQINPITYNYENSVSGLTLGVKNSITNNDLVVYKDHYVLVGKTDEIVTDYSDLENKNIGILKSNEELINEYITGATFTTYDTDDNLLTAFSEEIEYIIVPLNIYMDQILFNNYNVLYHFSDINYYFTISGDNSVLNSILTKYYNGTWIENFYTSYKENEFTTYVTALNITETDIHKLRSVIYEYGLLSSSPYEVIEAGEFGGISAVVLKEFSDFAGIEFNFKKYNNYKNFVSAIDKKELDMYFNKYNFTSEYKNTTDGLPLSFSVIANIEDNTVIDSVSALSGKTVYVEANSKLYDYVNTINGVTVKTYEGNELFKLNNDNEIIIIDKKTYETYSADKLDNYTIRYTYETDINYNYAIKDTEQTLYLLFNKYIDLLNDKQVVNEGFNNHTETVKAGNLIGLIARYIIILVIIGLIALYIVIKKTKKIKIAKKIKKDDKMKFIDQLTSLKNRNYLNECIQNWDNNTIYPQAIIIVNLNGVQKINDVHGYNEGDRQIKSFANALIKTQLDNSEVMRTDGNEFVIYLISYNQKQITNYIHKLNKEVQKLPYENGAKFGYSMIMDNLKTIEDCLNEASNDMKVKKENEKNK